MDAIRDDCFLGVTIGLMSVSLVMLITYYSQGTFIRDEMVGFGKMRFRSPMFWIVEITFVTGMGCVWFNSASASKERMVFGTVLTCIAVGLEFLRVQDQLRRTARNYSEGRKALLIYQASDTLNNLLANSMLILSLAPIIRRWNT